MLGSPTRGVVKQCDSNLWCLSDGSRFTPGALLRRSVDSEALGATSGSSNPTVSPPKRAFRPGLVRSVKQIPRQGLLVICPQSSSKPSVWLGQSTHLYYSKALLVRSNPTLHTPTPPRSAVGPGKDGQRGVIKLHRRTVAPAPCNSHAWRSPERPCSPCSPAAMRSTVGARQGRVTAVERRRRPLGATEHLMGRVGVRRRVRVMSKASFVELSKRVNRGGPEGREGVGVPRTPVPGRVRRENS
jgi:hypothetical protein